MAPIDAATRPRQRTLSSGTKQNPFETVHPSWQGTRLLHPKERSLLVLYHQRGATVAELAGLLGVSRLTVQRLLRKARQRVTNPDNLALVACWRRLTPAERRLVYLHAFTGVSLREIARHRLATVASRRSPTEAAASLGTLRSAMRAILRKARRWAHAARARHEDAPAGEPPATLARRGGPGCLAAETCAGADSDTPTDP